MSAFAPSALGSGRACRIRFCDEIDKSINKLQIVEKLRKLTKTEKVVEVAILQLEYCN